jgi:ribose transport system ATP-binding protein
VNAGLAFVTEDRREEGLMMDMPVSQNVSLVAQTRYATRGGVIAFARLREATARLINRMRIKVDSADGQAVKSLSGGNQQKVVIAKWMLSQPRFFILDEPTRGVDVGAKAEIYGLINDLADDGAGVLMISSELEELTEVCDRIVVMQAGRVTADVERAAFDSKAILLAAFGEAA